MIVTIEVRYITLKDVGGWASGQRRFPSYEALAAWLNEGKGMHMVYEIRRI